MKQILLITDGCSNVGESPVMAAAHARQDGITVNVIGVIDYGTIGELGSREIDDIAKAGGGLSRIVGTPQLAQTMQMMTRKTVVQTIQQAVNKEVKKILGEGSLEDLPPAKRSQVVTVVDELSETTPLRLALLIDASASMKPKLAAVEDAIRDLALSLEAREGSSEISVFHFPGSSSEPAVLDMDWSRNVSDIRTLFGKIRMKGATPTGPAIFKVLEHFGYDTLNEHQGRMAAYSDEGEGMPGGYVV
ncbi:Ca-activated chloride channel family protein [Paenibacillus sophorae]|uniref:Ca-activated chloride channel family protein n=1 Tax=Paenibacillus sophorae TaxID=1333845 RepID=A0A1H8V5X8_9BACL|nr:VWA domain-containing protein [Paenibacillus sophorae]SEP10667.1 Ca-activated chloride channel family protein [Paenibacillus sophorae]